MAYNILEIEGIGPAYAAKLATVDITTVEGLLEAGASKSGRKKLAEATEDKTIQRPLDKLVEKLTEGNTINLLLSAFMNKATKQPETIGNVSNDMKQTFDKFANVDPDYKNTLAKMADYLETNPSVLQQIKLIIGA